MRRRLFWTALATALAVSFALPFSGVTAPLQKRIDKKRAQVNKVKRREGVLTTTISGYNTRIESLRGEIRGTSRRLGRVQGDLVEQQAELARVRDRLEVARDRLERVRSQLATAREVLSQRLVEIYKADEPDSLTVVLEADGFEDLLERTEYLDRLSDQDAEVTDRVRKLRVKVKRRTDELVVLEDREEATTATIMRRRNDLASSRDRLVAARGELASARVRRRSALGRVRSSRVHLERDLDGLEAESARVAGRLRASAGGGGPIRRGGGRFIIPTNGSFTSPFGMRWGRLHAGVDIAAPIGTPIRAADSGRVAIAGATGGYGNYTCIQHGGNLSTCYAHQSRIGVSVGASVRQGQVIGAVGNTGNSTGPHLHFEVRVGGSPVNPMGYL
ncbi:MAG: peptidoglycan DD-metalloendopeptidase family protein [Actinomycetota bacterium]|nr:peptidoglycan DD-metalloendopeptidase family protein [Actinomycetota bacterium]